MPATDVTPALAGCFRYRRAAVALFWALRACAMLELAFAIVCVAAFVMEPSWAVFRGIVVFAALGVGGLVWTKRRLRRLEAWA